MGYLLSAIEDAYEWYVSVWVMVFESITDLLSDVFFLIFESIIDAVSGAFSFLFADFDFVSFSTYFAMLPSEVLDMLSLLGIAQCMTIIVSALGIRLVLQLIPFVRLGS